MKMLKRIKSCRLCKVLVQYAKEFLGWQTVVLTEQGKTLSKYHWYYSDALTSIKNNAKIAASAEVRFQGVTVLTVTKHPDLMLKRC